MRTPTRPLMAKTWGHGFANFFVPHFIGSDLAIAAILVYDLATRRRVHPLVGAAALFAVAVPAITTLVYRTPAWTPIATHLVGH